MTDLFALVCLHGVIVDIACEYLFVLALLISPNFLTILHKISEDFGYISSVRNVRMNA